MKNETYLKIELKYCERCGGLWYRYQRSRQVYCHSCLPEMVQIARGPRKQPASVQWSGLRGGAACA